jgi:hypothetical protein
MSYARTGLSTGPVAGTGSRTDARESEFRGHPMAPLCLVKGLGPDRGVLVVVVEDERLILFGRFSRNTAPGSAIGCSEPG